MRDSTGRTLAAAAAIALALSAGRASAARKTIEDDYAGALAEARRLGIPIVVDVWAPW